MEPVLALVAWKCCCLCWMLTLRDGLELTVKHFVPILVHEVDMGSKVLDVWWTPGGHW